MRPVLLDIVGQTFNRLTVLKYLYTIKNQSFFSCRCSCGKLTKVQRGNLKSGKTKSCGCLWLEKHSQRTHGKSNSPAYRSWAAMWTRCRNKNYSNYKLYGARGINVCARWESFENFFSDMGPRPEGMSLDRINSEGNYEPNNCRWASPKTQMRNRRVGRRETLNGETRCMSEWAEILGLSVHLLRYRMKRGGGQTFEQAVREILQTERPKQNL